MYWSVLPKLWIIYHLPSFSKPVANTCNDTRPASGLHQPISYLQVYKNNNNK